jgi:cap2 methyltransferase
MLQYLLPRLSPFFLSQLDIHNDATKYSNSLSVYLNDIKNVIHQYQIQWNIYKKITNPYEYIHTIIPGKQFCIAKNRPLSRSYYKMVEIVFAFDLGIFSLTEPIHSFHLAEGPGGFIQAISDLRKNTQDVYHGMTLIVCDKNDDIPAWKKSHGIFRDRSNIIIETGADKTGNILSLENFDHVVHMYQGTIDLVTADGGFDFSADFCNQETIAANLIFAQIAYALCLQKTGGGFVLKVFDTFTKYTVDLLALLSCSYEEVYVTKPNTSRYGNSEKYIVCKNFLLESKQLYPPLRKLLAEILSGENVLIGGIFPSSTVPCIFINRIEEINTIIGQQQIENIHSTIQLIHSDNEYEDKYNKHPEKRGVVQAIIKRNVQKCIQWCVTHKIPCSS